MPAISVIICSHNPREEYLRRTLDALKAQTLPATEWELLLVDNLSEPPLAGRFDLSWHPDARHVREERLGVMLARARGIAESKGNLVVYVDDDNVLRADYLQVCLKISADYPWLGSWGGSCIPEFEVEPSDELRPWLGGLVIEKLTTSVWAKTRATTEAIPPGAGMAVRRNVADRYQELAFADPVRQMLGRKGKMLGACEDNDIAMCGFDLGLGTGKFPELELTHLIPARKLRLEYLEGIHEGFGYSGVILRIIHKADSPPRKSGLAALKFFAFGLFMFLSGASRPERRIRLAEKRGELRAYRDLL